ncbi:aminoacyl tRNA synthase complex-interacting multifunctional protein 2-like [Mya arenaria]|uniref:aminoacyl tRNA synthase complex-interacting multifunctional protein 2-like n=1 Tax=Mya arenaria TaxID=6604 RepID=UPI0022E902C8|nr:aminoacyl tRNA synthase complex-interacting multifunctional protein 2-like [Mya arenaria]
MFTVKPFYEPQRKVELPDVMYKVKNFHEETSSNSADISSMDPVLALEMRQEKILTRLGELRQTLDQLKSRYAVTDTTPPPSKPGKATKVAAAVKSTSAVAIKSPIGKGIHDIVIYADPARPPLALFVLFEMLKQKYTVLATSYTHSSLTGIDLRFSDVIRSGSQVTRGNHQLALSVVWKKVENGPELMVSPAKQSVITGEVNIARYLNRLISPDFDTSDITMATMADEWLDNTDLQLMNGNSKQRNAFVKNLNNTLK